MIIAELKSLKNPAQANVLARFFKTGEGEYGEGDKFWGIKVPEIRKIAQKHRNIELCELDEIVTHEVHEVRLCGFLILTYKFPLASEAERGKIVDFYLEYAKYVNNWDLVDLSAPKILGEWLMDKDRLILYQLAESDNLWERRIAVLSCYAFIRAFDFKDALGISKILLNDGHDLIHKAVGWMLREVGKRDQVVLEKFLQRFHKKMPRVTLRYAIEKLTEEKRNKYLQKCLKK